jgi:hypothetical protein
MKKRIFILVLFISFSIHTQNKKQEIKNNGRISGIILDQKTKQPLPYVSIICKTKKDSILTGGITNKKGNFSIKKLPLDSLLVEIQYIGYKKVLKKVILITDKKIETTSFLNSKKCRINYKSVSKIQSGRNERNYKHPLKKEYNNWF